MSFPSVCRELSGRLHDSPGSRLGPYEILAQIGSGGIGEVWKARDEKLDRNVAVEVLPQSVAADPDTLDLATGRRDLLRTVGPAAPLSRGRAP